MVPKIFEIDYIFRMLEWRTGDLTPRFRYGPKNIFIHFDFQALRTKTWLPFDATYAKNWQTVRIDSNRVFFQIANIFCTNFKQQMTEIVLRASGIVVPIIPFQTALIHIQQIVFPIELRFVIYFADLIRSFGNSRPIAAKLWKCISTQTKTNFLVYFGLNFSYGFCKKKIQNFIVFYIFFLKIGFNRQNTV